MAYGLVITRRFFFFLYNAWFRIFSWATVVLTYVFTELVKLTLDSTFGFVKPDDQLCTTHYNNTPGSKTERQPNV